MLRQDLVVKKSKELKSTKKKENRLISASIIMPISPGHHADLQVISISMMSFHEIRIRANPTGFLNKFVYASDFTFKLNREN